MWHTDWDGVLGEMARIFEDPAEARRRRAHSAILAGVFHTHTDGRSAERVAAAAAGLVAARFSA